MTGTADAASAACLAGAISSNCLSFWAAIMTQQELECVSGARSFAEDETVSSSVQRPQRWSV